MKMATPKSLESLSKLEAEGGVSFEQAVKELAQESGRREINILATGKLAAGKSALINGFIGEEVATESDSLNQETRDVVKYSRNIDGIMFNVWDSPGFEANTVEETENMEMIAKAVPKADLLLFCIKMDEERLRKQDTDTITHFTKAFGQEVWQHTVFAMTFANLVVSVHDKNDAEARKKFFDERLAMWRKELHKALEKAGVVQGIAEKVNVLPVGYHTEPLLPNGQKNWLTMFWMSCFEAMKEQAKPALLKVNLKRLKSVQEIPVEDYYLPFYRQPIVADTLRKAVIPSATGLVGGAVGLGFGGPVGMTVGGVIGATTGYFLQGFLRNLIS